MQSEQRISSKEYYETFAASINNNGRWQNIQDVIKEAFHCVLMIVGSHVQEIHELQDRMQTMQHQIHEKISTFEFHSMKQNIHSTQDAKLASLQLQRKKELLSSVQLEIKNQCKTITDEHSNLISSCKHDFEFIKGKVVKLDMDISQVASTLERLGYNNMECKKDNFQAKSCSVDQKIAKIGKDLADCNRKIEKIQREQTKIFSKPLHNVQAPCKFEKGLDMFGNEQEFKFDDKNIYYAVNSLKDRLEATEAKFANKIKCWKSHSREAFTNVERELDEKASQKELVILRKSFARFEKLLLSNRPHDCKTLYPPSVQIPAELSATQTKSHGVTQMVDVIQRAQQGNINELSVVRRHIAEKLDCNEFEQFKSKMCNTIAVAESVQIREARQHKLKQEDMVEKIDTACQVSIVQTIDQEIQCSEDNTNNNLHDISEKIRNIPFKNCLEKIENEINALKQQIRSEIFLARFIWNTGRPHPGTNVINWSSQSINTNPELFLWTKDDPGMIQTKIPEKAVRIPLSTAESRLCSNVINHKQKKAQPNPLTEVPHVVMQRYNHTAGSIVGMSASVFLALPKNSTLSIAYNIDEFAVGFLNIRKM